MDNIVIRNTKIWLAWLLFVPSMALFAFAIVLVFANNVTNQWGDLSQVGFAIFSVMGMLIALRRPEHVIGWLFLIEGLLAALTFAGQQYAILIINSVRGEKPGPEVLWGLIPYYVASGFLWIVFFIIILQFPDGRLPSPRWRPFAVMACGLIAVQFVFSFRPGPVTVDPALPTVDNPLGIPLLAALEPYWDLVRFTSIAVGVVCLMAPIIRYRRADGIERQQLKWLAFGIGLLLLDLALFVLSTVVTLPAPLKAGLDLSAAFSAALVPVLMALAILNYRLYDIDLIIRRTLVYSTLSVTVAGLYWGGVVGLQALLRPLTGEGNDLAVVATTLAVAALFLPLRQRIQGFIDRRFFRRKYDAAHTLAQFGQVARDEVDLATLSGKLVGVVEETMQPEHVSLWLRR
jgi:hypothetical protein